MSDADTFQLVTTSSHHKIFDNFEEVHSAPGFDPDTSLQAALRRQYPELSLTATSASNVSLLAFAAAGNAFAELDIVEESIQRYRFFYSGDSRRGIPDRLVEGRTFAKYKYKWAEDYFIVYVISVGYGQYQYILKEPPKGESVLATPSITDKLIYAVGQWQKPPDYKFVYVYDGYWQQSRLLYNEIQKANWKNVILNEGMKQTLTNLMHTFFDSEDVYKDLGVPWKRGVIFHGPAGNGKTISIKALMHSLYKKYGDTIPSLYVKSAPYTFSIRSVFQQARYMAPCLLIFEDIDTIVTKTTRSYFFNEVDGLENNNGIFMVASTNHLDQLDPGLSSRPSRFDRKYLFPLPSTEERILYCEYWRSKLANKPLIKFPRKLCPAIAGITQDFSFAYLQEAFVATLLAIAENRTEAKRTGGEDDEGGHLDDYELWREMKKQVKTLRDDMDNRATRSYLSEIDHDEGQPAGVSDRVTGAVDPTGSRISKPWMMQSGLPAVQTEAQQMVSHLGKATFADQNIAAPDVTPFRFPGQEMVYRMKSGKMDNHVQREQEYPRLRNLAVDGDQTRMSLMHDNGTLPENRFDDARALL